VVFGAQSSRSVDRTPRQPCGGHRAPCRDHRFSQAELTEWEQNERQRIRETITEDAISTMVADNPLLLARILERTKKSAQSGTEAQRRAIARRLTETARDITPDTPGLATSDVFSTQHRGWKRSAIDWATLLNELATQLANGQFYSRDLPMIDEPLHLVAERYVRRRSE